MGQENPSVIRIRQKFWAIYMKTSARFMVARDIKYQYKRSLRVKWYQVVSLSVCPHIIAAPPGLDTGDFNENLSRKSKFHYVITYVRFTVPGDINPLNTKRRLLYLKTQFVPRSKHFSSRL